MSPNAFVRGLIVLLLVAAAGCVARPTGPTATQTVTTTQTVETTVTATPSSHSDYLVNIWYWWLGNDGQDTFSVVVNITNHAGEPRSNDQGSVETASGRQYRLFPQEQFLMATSSTSTTEFRYYHWPSTQTPTVFWFANISSESLADCNCQV